MRRLHIALGVADIAQTVEDYAERLQAQPSVVVPGEYALWRTPSLNFSVRRVPAEEVGQLRHLGWEDSQAEAFSQDTDCNGVVWERFNLSQQLDEVALTWPGAALGSGRHQV